MDRLQFYLVICSALAYVGLYSLIIMCLVVKYVILFQIKKNIVSVQLNAAQYSKVVESLTAENEELKLKLRTYEAQNACQKSTTMSTVQSNHKEKLSAPYQELEAMNTEISKLVKEIKLLNWRNHVKQKIADRLPCLSINNIQLDKVI